MHCGKQHTLAFLFSELVFQNDEAFGIKYFVIHVKQTENKFKLFFKLA